IADNTPITFTWTLDGTPIPGQTGTVPSGTTLTLDLGQIEEGEEGEYCLELVSTNGCVNEPPTCTQVTVNPTPEIETVTGGGTYCEGVDVSLSGTGVSGLGNVTYMWMGPNGFVFNGGPVPSQGPFPATINDIAVAGEGEYMLIVKLGDCADTATVVVNVNPKPIITVISGNETTCLDSDIEISFSIDPNGASSVNWNFDCPFFDTSGTVTTLTTITFTLNVDGTFTGTITAESNDGCEAEPQQIQVTVQEIPTPVITASTNVLCEGDALTLSTTPQTGTSVSYEWFKDGVSIGTTTVPTFNVVPPAPGSYTVTVTVDGCDATSEPTVVTSPAAPLANDDTYNSTTITPVSGNVTDNDDTSTGVIATLLDGPVPGLVFNPDGTFTYTPGTPALPEVTFNYEICLEDCPEECSEATVTITFVVECIIPNIMTPNGDNVNDVLQVDCLEGNAFPNNRLRVFNRWGDEIQAFEPYENNWDGTYGSDKKAVPAATYFYLLELDKNAGSGDDNVRSGYIKVVR
ncbi:MAG: gliding motility-associated C-terminal domain-containing protein, partial [Saprospiraceae bacterium]|nr:gliding motility-associated C-terminal domain-containing protein [Saprospiraceae bacterium]